MPSKDGLAYEVCLDLTAQELLALPASGGTEGGDDIRDIDLLLRAKQNEAAVSSEDSLEIELTAEEMLSLLVGDVVTK